MGQGGQAGASGVGGGNPIAGAATGGQFGPNPASQAAIANFLQQKQGGGLMGQPQQPGAPQPQQLSSTQQALQAFMQKRAAQQAADARAAAAKAAADKAAGFGNFSTAGPDPGNISSGGGGY